MNEGGCQELGDKYRRALALWPVAGLAVWATCGGVSKAIDKALRAGAAKVGISDGDGARAIPAVRQSVNP